MQFTTVFTVIAFAAATYAGVLPRQDNSGEICPAGKQQACCKTLGASLIGGSCELNILGENCSGNIQCCQVDSSGSLLSGSCGAAIAL